MIVTPKLIDRERPEGVYLTRVETADPTTPLFEIERVNGNDTVSRVMATRDEAETLLRRLIEELY